MKYRKWTIILGILFLLIYICQDILYSKIWIGGFLLLVILGILLFILFLVGLIKKEKLVIPIFMTIAMTVGIIETLRSEIFKSKKVLEATLHDDLSAINLTLRKNSTFEVSAVSIFSEEKFTGKYKIDDDKIIFLTRPYNNELIPDTVKILNEK